MLISIIIPVYNEEKYIKEILKKINNVKNINKEIIVVIDKSTDNTKKILEEESKNLPPKTVIYKNGSILVWSIPQHTKPLKTPLILFGFKKKSKEFSKCSC